MTELSPELFILLFFLKLENKLSFSALEVVWRIGGVGVDEGIFLCEKVCRILGTFSKNHNF
jgi:hypothetical protein